MPTTITSTEFHRSTFRDLSVAAKQSPVSITTDGKPAYVLLSYKEYCRLTATDNCAVPTTTAVGTESASVENQRQTSSRRVKT